jgi:methylenetetrahydrofolate reductase (NADPH)
MKISGILKNHFSLSFEFFPPRTEEAENDLFQNIKKLELIHPSFVSVTYGAGGSTRDKTRQIVIRMSNQENLNVMAHLAAVGHTREEVLEIVQSYKDAGIDNILALRGDKPAGTDINPSEGEIPHSSDLIELIRDRYRDYFSIGGAVFPERHLESPNWEWEIQYLKKKVDAGLDFAISQIFFVNQFFFDFVDKCEKYQIKIPIIPGIMPITNFQQIKRFASMCGATIPHSLTGKLAAFGDNNEEVAKAGVEYAVSQCEELLKFGVRGLHFYTLNKSNATLKIYDAIKDSVVKLGK